MSNSLEGNTISAVIKLKELTVRGIREKGENETPSFLQKEIDAEIVGRLVKNLNLLLE